MEQLTIGELVAWIESRGDAAAIRFEPTVYNKFAGNISLLPKAVQVILQRIQIVNRCNVHTAAMIYSSSWGAYQSMGFNVYADECETTISDYLGSPRLQAAQFNAFLKRSGLADFTPGKLAADQAARYKFSIKYNGSIAYETGMINALTHFGLAISPLT